MITVQLISVIEIIFWAVNLVSLHYPFILFYQTASLSLKLHVTEVTDCPDHSTSPHRDCRGLPYPELHGEMLAPCLSARHCPPSSWHLRFTTSPVLSEGTEEGDDMSQVRPSTLETVPSLDCDGSGGLNPPC